MSRHRDAPLLRPRFGRVALAGTALLVTGVALVGGVSGAGAEPDVAGASSARDPAPTSAPAAPAAPVAPAVPSAEAVPVDASNAEAPAPAPGPPAVAEDPKPDKSVPASSGEGRRVVFSGDRQRVWLIDDEETVQRTYPVSGSVYDNLDPGTYAVYSRSEQAYGIDDSGTMKYFVRFTQGENAAIGFHDIPIDDGRHVQTTAQLGTPLSHGCIRQQRTDAIALWDFAPIDTEVVVTA